MTTATVQPQQLNIWWVFLLQGIAAIPLGAMLFTAPGATLVTLVTFLGFYWIVSGVLSFVQMFVDRSVPWIWSLLIGIIGVAAGIVCYWGCTGLKHMFGYDDALDAFGVHAVGGVVGALLTGVFAVEAYGGTAGLIEGNAAQMINQVKGICIVFVYDAIVSLIILKVIDAIIGLRVSDEVEREGLDLALHGETVQ